jgi:light-regulated signal transduction histidine kinase (bacteriophytochrome)
LCFVVDISERVEQERELREHRLDLERSNAELAQFAYVASHDLQEPLRVIAAYAQRLARMYQGNLDEKADRYIHHMVEGTIRMQRLVKGLLQLSRVGRKEMTYQEVDCNALLERVLRGLARAIDDCGGSVRGEDLPTVSADETHLEQVFQNLIANAIKFHGERAPKVEVRATRRGDLWQFAVEDNGIGIDMANKDKVFLMFHRLHERSKYEGSGIGLTLSQKVVQSHGGEIWFESSPEGTTFYFTLPEQAPTQG